ncbi:MAG: Cyclohexanone monooxygenase [Burkholderiaceae bacterium]|jgi:cation diffusion facilitator CzcD-associated flavoprotein CzcO|nr:MAG: Cyclohexanone monooxygenase [Burkholderiaceae bacterium]
MPSVVIIGSGYAGLCVAIKLRQAGMRDFVLLEQADAIGGTWRDNGYPGAACDIPSHLYSFSFEPNPNWSRLYPTQPELRAYVEHCVDKYGLRPHIRCSQRVTALRFDEQDSVWRVQTSDGGELRSRVVVSATGGLSRPALPGIPGLDTFAGALFHSARWNHAYDLTDKRVAVIGTGASAIQFVPQIAPRVRALTLFQRTPAWILPKPDRPLSDAERARFARQPWRQRLARTLIYWTLEARAILFTRWPALLRRVQPQVLRFVARHVPDAALRAKLTPRYTMGCKRILLSNDFYPALALPQVRLETTPIIGVDAGGIHTADGAHHAADAIIFGTGFQVADAGTPFPVFGRGGIEMNRVWAGGSQAYLGSTVAGFPNLFLMTGPNTGLAHNSMIFMIEAQTRYVVDAILGMAARGLRSFDLHPEVQRRFNEWLQRRMAPTVWATGGCRSWYLTRDGRNVTLWPGFTFDYRRRTRRFDWHSYALTPATGG